MLTWALMISTANLTKEHFCVAIKWIAKMSDAAHWNLSETEVAKLIGLDSVVTYSSILKMAEDDALEEISHETVERLSLLLGIWKQLQLFVPHNRVDLAFSWFSQPNKHEMFQNQSIKEYLLSGNSIERFYDVKQYFCERVQIPD